MEFLYFLFCLLLLVIPFILLLTKESSKRIPPGSMGLPIIGHSLSLVKAMRANKGEVWFQERINKYGPISKLSLFGSPTVFLHGQAANKFIYTCDSNTFSSQQPAPIRRLFGEGNILELSGENHRRVRGAILSFLKPDVLKQSVGKIDEEVRKHLQMHWQGKSKVTVIWAASMTHMDETVFPNPSKFDPARFEKQTPCPPYCLVAFGGGQRICPGYEFAKTETLAMIHHLVTQFTWKLSCEDNSFCRDPTPVFNQGLPIHIQPKKSDDKNSNE